MKEKLTDFPVPVDQAELVKLRRELHMCPELRWDLDRTAALVKRELDAAGFHHRPAGGHGCAAHHGKQSFQTLPVPE